MNERELAEALSVHAEGLKDGVDLTSDLLAAEGPGPKKALEGLLTLARRVKAALVPVAPRPEFVAGLRSQLQARARGARRPQSSQIEKQRELVWVAAGLGGVLYLTSLALISLRTALAVMSLVAAIAGWRAARKLRPKARRAT